MRFCAAVQHERKPLSNQSKKDTAEENTGPLSPGSLFSGSETPTVFSQGYMVYDNNSFQGMIQIILILFSAIYIRIAILYLSNTYYVIMEWTMEYIH